MKTSDYQNKYVSPDSMQRGTIAPTKKIICQKSYFGSIEYPYVVEDLQYDTEGKYDLSIPQVVDNIEDSYSPDGTIKANMPI